MRNLALKSNIRKNCEYKKRRITEISIFLIIIGFFCISENYIIFFPNSELNNETIKGRKGDIQPFKELSEMKLPSCSVNKIWNVSWDYSLIDEAYSIWGDGSYLYTVGYTDSNNDLILIKWDLFGNLVWNRTFGGDNYDDGYSIWGDGTYLYTIGGTTSFGDINGDFLLTKWDINGSLIFSTTWGGAGYEYGYSIWGDGSYLYTTGSTTSFSTGNDDLAIVKWDPNGNKIWNTTWGGSGDEYANSIWGDGTYLYTTGDTNSFGAGNRDLFLIKWDLSGNLVWNRTFGGTSYDAGVSLCGDGTHLYTIGYTNSFSIGSSDLLLIKWDPNGNQIWNTTWGGSGSDLGDSIFCDGIYLYTLGTTRSFGVENQAIFVVKWDLNGNQILNITHSGSKYEAYMGYSIWGENSYVYTTGSLLFQLIPTYDIFVAKFNVFSEPYVNSPPDITYLVGTTGKNISWIATDSYTINPQYIIYRNGAIYTTGSWSYGIPITLNLDPYATGVFNYTIIVFDGYGGRIQDVVIVTVTPDLNINHLPDTTFPAHETGNILSWMVNDTATLISPTYEIYKNNILVANGTWDTISPISFNMYDYTGGIYNITIKVNDGWGDGVSDETFVTIIESNATGESTLSVSGISSYTYDFNSANNEISWKITTNGSFSSRTYIIYRNGSSIASGSWNSGYNLSLNIDYLPVGIYNYTIIAIGDDKIAQNTTIVTVTGNSSDIVNPNIPGYNIPIILFSALAFIKCISIGIKKKMRKI